VDFDLKFRQTIRALWYDRVLSVYSLHNLHRLDNSSSMSRILNEYNGTGSGNIIINLYKAKISALRLVIPSRSHGEQGTA